MRTSSSTITSRLYNTKTQLVADLSLNRLIFIVNVICLRILLVVDDRVYVTIMYSTSAAIRLSRFVCVCLPHIDSKLIAICCCLNMCVMFVCFSFFLFSPLHRVAASRIFFRFFPYQRRQNKTKTFLY